MNTKESFLDILHSVDRKGIDKIINYLEETTFFIDPASCTEHNSYEGGLVEHSLNVYNILEKNCKQYPEMNGLDASIKIVGLLHDVCQIGTFQKISKNVTVKGKDGKNVLKENGRILFVEKEMYDPFPEGQLPYPRGTLSTILIKKHMSLTKLEDLTIQWHLGAYDQPRHLWNVLNRAQKMHKLVFKLFSAKREAILYHDHKVEVKND